MATVKYIYFYTLYFTIKEKTQWILSCNINLSIIGKLWEKIIILNYIDYHIFPQILRH